MMMIGTTLNAGVNGGGQISTTPGGPLFAFGSKARLTALPNSGSYFNRWLGAVRTTNNPVDLTVTNATPSVLAVFPLLPHQRTRQGAPLLLPAGAAQPSASRWQPPRQTRPRAAL